jgi:hypothetical protein
LGPFCILTKIPEDIRNFEFIASVGVLTQVINRSIIADNGKVPTTPAMKQLQRHQLAYISK